MGSEVLLIGTLSHNIHVSHWAISPELHRLMKLFFHHANVACLNGRVPEVCHLKQSGWP
jgi:hypothetical protein